MTIQRTNIITNGSKWAGQEPDGLLALFERLGTYTLDSRHAPFAHDLPDRGDGQAWVGFMGNFLEVSAGFWVKTCDAFVAQSLHRAIRENMLRPGYARKNGGAL